MDQLSLETEKERFENVEDPALKEETYVHTVYNEIASHFSQTRYKPWPIVEKFLTSRKKYSIGLDVGCGNGKYLGVNKNLMILGSDRSDGLIRCAYKNGHRGLLVADGLQLPHHDDRFDFAVSIAVIHHFSTEERRIQAIKHILSKLRPQGEALIYCWALEQENSRRGWKEGMDQDQLVPWVMKSQNEQQTKLRYYHLYKKGELIENSVRAGGEIVEDGYEKDNWWVIVRKI
ncbi:BA75_02776T0 [Komagataella pastoris]|uniref:BA75_02776T0 n=1 Tax=Komagataella pastoris TaxID=4922 RepID=A0A1B2JCT2_PICPA|nr:BA75_02776T0 [Komagataella pastoris]